MLTTSVHDRDVFDLAEMRIVINVFESGVQLMTDVILVLITIIHVVVNRPTQL